MGVLETALSLLKAAIRNGQITSVSAKRDPILNETLDDALAELLL